ncbi:hypothetical protein JXQ31_19350 [candidate division KSB1 bacterium]|nr:hypothetical protein [candidate division KSB1 bacterium]
MKKILIIFFSLIFLHCGKFTTEPEKKVTGDPTIEELLDSGWADFTASQYDSAQQKFDKVLAQEPENVAANVGKGWALLLRDSNHLQLVILCLEKGLTDGNWVSDCRTGIIVAKFNQAKYDEIPALVNYCLKDNPAYSFSYQPKIDWRDLILIKAQALYFTKKYKDAWTEIKKLTTKYNYIDPQASETWVVDDVSYFSFEAVLSKIIQIVSVLYR